MRAQATSPTDLLDASAFAERVALVHGDERISYAELDEQVERLAAGLAARGIGGGAPVALVLPNVPAFAVAFLAILRAGAVAVPLNPLFKEAELEFHFADSGARAVIAAGPAAAACAGVVERLDTRPELIADLDAVAASGGSSAPPAAPAPDADAVFQYSSGSTGRPKRVPRSHRHLRAEADAYVAATGLGPEDTVFCTIPLFHTYGMGCCLLAAVRSGATLTLFDEPHPFVLQRGRALAQIERERATVLPAVPFTFRLLAEAPEQTS
jgi:long-chain acyl-CoA synthetase